MINKSFWELEIPEYTKKDIIEFYTSDYDT